MTYTGSGARLTFLARHTRQPIINIQVWERDSNRSFIRVVIFVSVLKKVYRCWRQAEEISGNSALAESPKRTVEQGGNDVLQMPQDVFVIICHHLNLIT